METLLTDATPIHRADFQMQFNARYMTQILNHFSTYFGFTAGSDKEMGGRELKAGFSR